MFGLSSPVFDIAGAATFPQGRVVPKDVSRRARRVATLDGGVVLSDLGYTDLDREYALTVPAAARRDYEFIRRLIATYQTAILLCDDGVFLVLLSGLSATRGDVSLLAQVLEIS